VKRRGEDYRIFCHFALILIVRVRKARDPFSSPSSPKSFSCLIGCYDLQYQVTGRGVEWDKIGVRISSGGRGG
jgi:hypothetical protein